MTRTITVFGPTRAKKNLHATGRLTRFVSRACNETLQLLPLLLLSISTIQVVVRPGAATPLEKMKTPPARRSPGGTTSQRRLPGTQKQNVQRLPHTALSRFPLKKQATPPNSASTHIGMRKQRCVRMHVIVPLLLYVFPGTQSTHPRIPADMMSPFSGRGG